MSNEPIILKCCRICGNANLVKVLDLGLQAQTGVFPKSADDHITVGPLQLVKCHGSADEEVCGLLQLGHTYNLGEMYGDNYGYRSGLNSSMVTHLRQKVSKILEIVQLVPGDLIVDIGSNDGTTLGAYPSHKFRLVGIDPTGEKFKQYYPPEAELISDFFSEQKVRSLVGEQQAKVITSFSMYYDLESPLGFAREIRQLLAPEGIWVFEQSYMPRMLEQNSYDTVCHEHLEYYGLQQIKWITDRSDLKIVDVEFNDVNGGSFSVSVAPSSSSFPAFVHLDQLLQHEKDMKLDQLGPYLAFSDRVVELKNDLLRFVREAKMHGKKIAGLGASTKGNVLLQYCGLSKNDLSCIGEVNPDKYGCVTPGSHIPIVSEDEVLNLKADYLLVLPWHFKSFFTKSKKFRGSTFLFPLPSIELHNAQ